MPTLPVGANTNPASLAGAITRFLFRDKQSVQLSCIGAGSNFAAGRALAVVRCFAAKERAGILERIYFETVEVRGERRTSITFSLETFPLK